MDQSPIPPSTPTPEPDGATLLCTPRPHKKRVIIHIATPDLDHQAKKFKTGHQSHENDLGNEAILPESPCLDGSEHSNKLHTQSAQTVQGPNAFKYQDVDAIVAGHDEDMDSLHTQLADLKAKMHDLEAQISIKDKQLQDLKEFIAIQHLQPSKFTPQGPDDSAVTSKFTTLRYAIRNLTMVELHGKPFVKPTKTDQKNLFSRMTQTDEDYKGYLGESEFKSFFFEGVIWTVLIDRLLGSPLSAFLDVNEGIIRDQVYKHSGASPQKFHAWRAYTADFLEDAFGPRTPWKPWGELRSKLVSELVDLLSRYSTSGSGNVVVFTQQLDDIVDKAVNLAWLMAKSRAYWVCSLPTHPETKLSHGFVYLNETTKVERYLEGGLSDVVDLVGRPSLLKYGDSNGEQYDTCVVFEKASALVFEGKKAKKAKKADADHVPG